jgi:hypothetical protein
MKKQISVVCKFILLTNPGTVKDYKVKIIARFCGSPVFVSQNYNKHLYNTFQLMKHLYSPLNFYTVLHTWVMYACYPYFADEELDSKELNDLPKITKEMQFAIKHNSSDICYQCSSLVCCYPPQHHFNTFSNCHASFCLYIFLAILFCCVFDFSFTTYFFLLNAIVITHLCGETNSSSLFWSQITISTFLLNQQKSKSTRSKCLSSICLHEALFFSLLTSISSVLCPHYIEFKL